MSCSIAMYGVRDGLVLAEQRCAVLAFFFGLRLAQNGESFTEAPEELDSCEPTDDRPGVLSFAA